MTNYTEDPTVNSVVDKYINRSRAGMETYGVTMSGNNLPFSEWIQHAQQEAMDFSLYLERLSEEYAVWSSVSGRFGFYDYEEEAATTAVYPREHALMYPALGLAGEAGEVADKVKKIFRDKGGVLNDDDRKAIAKELGDVLWYIAALCRDLNVPMYIVAQENLNKLRDRKARGVIGGSGDNR